MSYSSEQIMALAPDASSAKAGRALANAGKWRALGFDERAVWGECQGSGKDPYRTQIDLVEPAFRCTCPSRKFPCKHALGLFLLFAAQASTFEQGERPVWVVEWLEKRDKQSKHGQKEAAGESSGEDAAPKPKKASPKSKRTTDRRARVAAGLAELELWLRDLVRRGLAATQSQPPKYWEQMAARLIDAQAPGAARRVREISGIPASTEGWSEVVLARVGLLFLLVEAFKRIDELPDAVQADVLTCAGWTIKEEELSEDPGVRDRWLVTGLRNYEEDKLRVQRTWLRGERSARDAVLLEFAAPGQVPKFGALPGTQMDAELLFYPGNYPLRAVVKERHSAPVAGDGAALGYASSGSFLETYAEGLARNPWLEVFPALLDKVVPVKRGEDWQVRDSEGRLLRLSPRFNGGWKLLALSGGQSLTLFGEWDGRYLLPLGVWVEGRYARV